MGKYLIYYDETPTSKKYVEYINRSGESVDSDIGDAIEFDDKELAIDTKDYLIRRGATRQYKVMCIKTMIEEGIM